MDHYLVWLMAGFALVIAELVTTTFYLLVLGIAAFAGAGVAYAGGGFAGQAIIAALVAVAGVFWVNQYRKRAVPKRMRGIDVGQPACFDSWINKGSGHLAKTNNTMIVPSNLADVASIVASAMTVLDNTRSGIAKPA